jgi:hypothetical protein
MTIIELQFLVLCINGVVCAAIIIWPGKKQEKGHVHKWEKCGTSRGKLIDKGVLIEHCVAAKDTCLHLRFNKRYVVPNIHS